MSVSKPEVDFPGGEPPTQLEITDIWQGDDPPSAELELQRVAPVPARVEFFARRERDSDIVNLDHVTWVRHGAIALPDVRDLQLCRRLAAGKVDLRLADAHTRLSL